MRGALLFGAAASLAGCAVSGQVAGLRTAAVDPTSPVYQDVMNATRHPGPYPKFSEIPKIPTDVRSPTAWAAAVAAVKLDKTRLEEGVAALPPPPADSEAFAANERTQTSAPAAAPAPDAAVQTQAYADSLRKRAIPPPKRRAHKR